MILIKLGGSVITNKERALSARRRAVGAIAGCLRRIRGEPLIIVHGGGSYGHYWSVRYGMHTKPAEYGVRGVSVVKRSMADLNKIVLDALGGSGLNACPLPPEAFMDGRTPSAKGIREAGRMAEAGLVPVTYGDAVWHGGRGRRSYILSGDRIMTHLSGVLRPRLAIFALNVDGVYSDMGAGELVERIGGGPVRVSAVKMDVTGGMARKMSEARAISRMGLDVFFVNGNRPERIVGAVKKSRFEGTLFAGR